MENIKDEMKILRTVAGDNANRSVSQSIFPRDVEVLFWAPAVRWNMLDTTHILYLASNVERILKEMSTTANGV